MNVSDTLLNKPSSNDMNSITQAPDVADDMSSLGQTEQGQFQSDGPTLAENQQTSGSCSPAMTDAECGQQPDGAMVEVPKEPPMAMNMSPSFEESPANPQIIVSNGETSVSSPKDTLPAEEDDLFQNMASHSIPADPSADAHQLSEQDQPQPGRDSSAPGPRDSLDDGRSDSTEDDTSDWETPVDVELEVTPVSQRSSKASWSAVKAVTRWMPMGRSSVSWSQLAGHKGSFLAGPEGTVLKVCDPCEQKNLTRLEQEQGTFYHKFVPKYHGTVEKDGIDYVRMQDLQSQFSSPSIMDIKMGVRTYLQKELVKAQKEPTLRKDLYEKMVSVDPDAPTAEERQQQAITKTRYLKFRDDMSSTSSLGFRIEGIKTPTIASKDFKKTRTSDDVQKVLSDFVGDNSEALETYISLLKDIHTEQQSSPFFRSHETVGSSLLFLHDSSGKAGVWMIDFAKCSPLPPKVTVDHSSPWLQSNYEDGYWFGLSNLRSIFQQIDISKGKN